MPSSHSSSSHSSSSHSSSSHSSGGFSSHSSGGFSSHSSSSHSSSWGSSSSSWGSSRSSRSSDRSWGSSAGLWAASGRSRGSGPSAHSQTSRSSAIKYRSHYVRNGSMQGRIIERARYNQPRGYVAGDHHNITPIPHYCVHHNYLFYPMSWTDESTGQEYKRGYYDENGQYYENVVFRSDGKYQNVICQCEYCDTVTKIDWTEGGPLICPQCGGTMKILSALDEYTQDPNYESLRHKADYVDYADRNSFSDDGSDYDEGSYDDGSYDGGSPMKALMIVLGIIAAFILFIALGSRNNSRSVETDPYDANHRAEDGWVYLGNGTWVQYYPWNGQNNQGGDNSKPLTNPELFGDVIHLNETEPGAYVITKDSAWDRELVWSEEDESYYDSEADYWAWYNTEVDPPLWQYWYEPISGDFGDYGWMEYEDGVWYIEASQGDWIELPEEYDRSPLWHIESSPELWDEDESSEDVAFPGDTDEDLQGPRPYGSEIRLEERVPGVFRISQTDSPGKILVWDEEEKSYYDADTDLWLWYNTEVDPPLWQYWYEPISGDFGDYGWMEYEAEEWYIETEAGIWELVPEEYDTSVLWHIETDD